MTFCDDQDHCLTAQELRTEIERLTALTATQAEDIGQQTMREERLRAAHSWQNICLAYQGDTQPCATPCLHCDRISRALEGK